MKKKDIRNHIIRHIYDADDWLEPHTLAKIKEENPDIFCSGQAFRVLLFDKPPTRNISINNDTSFSRSLEGIKNFLSCQDLDDAPYAIIYSCHAHGLDIVHAAEYYDIPNPIVGREKEIVPLEIQDVIVYMEGDSKEIYDSL